MGAWHSVCSTADAIKYVCASIGSAIYSAAARVRKGATYFAGRAVGMLRSAYDRGVSAVYSVAGSVRNGARYIASMVGGIFRGSYARGPAARDEGVKGTKKSVPYKEGLRENARLLLRLMDEAMELYTRGFTGGLPVYKILKQVLLKKYVKTVDHVTVEELMRRVELLEHVVFWCYVHS